MDWLLFLEINYTNISQDWMGFFLSPYKNILGIWMWPIVFIGLIGYVYAVQKSATAAAVMICIIFGIFGATDALANNLEFTSLSIVLSTFAIAGAFTALFMKSRR